MFVVSFIVYNVRIIQTLESRKWFTGNVACEIVFRFDRNILILFFKQDIITISILKN